MVFREGFSTTATTTMTTTTTGTTSTTPPAAASTRSYADASQQSSNTATAADEAAATNVKKETAAFITGTQYRALPLAQRREQSASFRERNPDRIGIIVETMPSLSLPVYKYAMPKMIKTAAAAVGGSGGAAHLEALTMGGVLHLIRKCSKRKRAKSAVATDDSEETAAAAELKPEEAIFCFVENSESIGGGGGGGGAGGDGSAATAAAEAAADFQDSRNAPNKRKWELSTVSSTLSSVFAQHGNRDGFLYLYMSRESTFGGGEDEWTNHH